MKNWKSEIICTAFNQQQLPPQLGREVVLVGRSNVGKSTLINALLGRKVAHVSSKAGKTRSINFYSVEDGGGFYLVDLPGYGFASRSGDERRGWWKLIDGYFATRQNDIAFVIHLVDFRHGFLANDVELTEWLDQLDLPRLVVFTKGDKVSPGRKRGTYVTHLKSGMESILPPPITEGKNDAEMNRRRESILEILAEHERLAKLEASRADR